LIHFIFLKFKSTWILQCAMNHIPLEHYLKAIPKLKSGLQKDGTGKVETGIKFNTIYKLFQKNKIVVLKIETKCSWIYNIIVN